MDKIYTEDGYHLAQIHHVDFSDDGDIVLELLLGNSNSYDSMLELVRINLKTGEAAPVHKTLKDGRLWFIGLKAQGTPSTYTPRTAKLWTSNQPEHKRWYLSTPSGLIDR